MTSSRTISEPEALHSLKNHLGVVLCFAQLVTDSLDADDPRRDDLAAIHGAAREALDLLPIISKLVSR